MTTFDRNGLGIQLNNFVNGLDDELWEPFVVNGTRPGVDIFKWPIVRFCKFKKRQFAHLYTRAISRDCNMEKWAFLTILKLIPINLKLWPFRFSGVLFQFLETKIIYDVICSEIFGPYIANL